MQIQKPMYHIDAFILAKHGEKIIPFLTNDVIKYALAPYFGFKPNDDELLSFISLAQLEKAYEVKALAAIGIPQIHIADMIGVSQGMISRYMKMDMIHHYQPNKFINTIRIRYAVNKEEKWKYYYETYCHDFTGVKMEKN